MTTSIRAISPKITSTVVSVDPATAERWLEANTHNRDMKQFRVNQYSHDMRNGRWHFNGEPIQFSRDGSLLNGQHRLQAVVDTGLTQTFLVVRGLDPQTQLTMDQGTRRTPGEQLAVSGVRGDNTIAGAIRVYITWASGRLFGDQVLAKTTTTEVVEWAHENPHMMDTLYQLSSLGLRRIPVRPALALAVALRLHEIDVDEAQVFFGAVLSGANLRSDSPCLALKNRLRRIKDSGTKVSDRDLIGLFVVAWNAERQGRTMTKLQRPSAAGWTVDTFPVPI